MTLSATASLRARVVSRPPAPALAAAAVWGLAAWATAGTLAVTGDTSGARVALLAPWWIAAAGAGAALAFSAVVRVPANSWWPLFLPSLLLLAWLPWPVPAAFLIWVGPLAWLVWAGTLAAMVASWWPSGAPDALRNQFRTTGWSSRVSAAVLLVGFGVYGASAWSARAVLPAGDAPHYLVITQSLLRDGDLRIENNHARRDYAEYFAAPLRPDYLRRGKDGQIYSIHAPGLPVIVAPAFALGGYPAVVVFLAFVSALGGWLAWRAALLATGSASAALFGWAATALTAPFLLHSFQVFPDALGAVLTMTGVVALVKLELGSRDRTAVGPAERDAATKEPGDMGWLWHGAALAALPWCHTRFAAIALVLGGCLSLRLLGARRYKHFAAFAAVPIASMSAWFWYFHAIYGSFNPAAPYGHYTQSSLANVPAGLPALLFDQQFGLCTNAPVYAVGMAGLALMLKWRRRLAVELTIVVLAYLVAVASYAMWWGGYSAPARFAVPVLLIFALPAAGFWSRSRTASRASALVLLFVSLFVAAALVTVDGGRLIFNGRDGVARWLEWAAPLVDLPRALPSFLAAGQPARWAPTAAWIGILAGACAGLAAVGRLVSKPAHLRGILALAAPVAFSSAAMLATAVCWRLQHAEALTPTTAQVRLLNSVGPDSRWGLQYRPLRVMTAAQLVPALRLRASTRRALLPSTALFLSGLPAGDYLLEPPYRGAGYRSLDVRVGRSANPVERWIVDRPGPENPLPLRLPVGVTAVTVSAEAAEAAPGVPPGRGLALRPLAVRPGPPFPDEASRRASGLASRAARYGSVIVLAFTDLVYFEEEGFWITGGRDDCIVVAPDVPRRRVGLLARNSGPPNVVTLRSNGWRATLTLAAGEEREVDVPLDPVSGAVVLQVHTASGFRPSQTLPGSRDERYLGVWLQVRPPS